MKNIYINKHTILLLIGILFFASSCNEFLDEAPDNRVNLDDLDNAAQLLTNAYSEGSYAFTDWMSDNSAYTRGVTIRPSQEDLYMWEEVQAGPTEQDSPIYFWFTTYNAIAHANEVLAALDQLPAETEEEINRRNAIESEALLTRAYGHFMLVNIFGKHYNEETAEEDLGIPYVETPETTFIAEYERKTVQEVYDLVERDMLRGIELSNDSFFENSGKYHFNRNAALAFASRFYLFKGDFRECREYCDELLGSNPESFIRDMTSSEFQTASASIEGYPQLYSSPDLQSNLLLMRKISLVQRTDFGHGFTRALYNDLFAANPYGTTDARENPAFVKGDNGLLPVRYQSLFQRNSLSSNVGTPYNITIAFRGEEVLLNRMEANIYLNNASRVLEDLQILVERRYAGDPVVTMQGLRSFYGVGNNPNVNDRVILLEYIINFERRREFMIQGMRWFDIKRFELPVTHDLLDGSTIELEEDDLRKVLQIPQSAIDVGGLEPNPR